MDNVDIFIADLKRNDEDEEMRQAALYDRIFDTGFKECILSVAPSMEAHVKSLDLGVEIRIDNNMPEGMWRIEYDLPQL